MSTLDVGAALEVPGRLAAGCTSLSTAFPHGGTALGFVGEIVAVVDAPVRIVRYEEHGHEFAEVVSAGEAWAIMGTLRSWDDAALALYALNSAAGTTTQRRVVTAPGSNRAGYLFSGRSTPLVFTPETVIAGHDAQHPLVVFHKAIPLPRAQARLELRLGRQFGLPIAFAALRDANSHAASVGFRQDLSL